MHVPAIRFGNIAKTAKNRPFSARFRTAFSAHAKDFSLFFIASKAAWMLGRGAIADRHRKDFCKSPVDSNHF